ncbi:MAG: dihydropteroate synthase [Pseudomonadota bacterium]
MGVLNVTPDSFSDGGKFRAVDDALRHVAKMLEDGAAIIDVGGESTRPGAAAVGEAEELQRVIPIIEHIRARFDVPISVDTSTPAVMAEAAAAGAALINDVRALRRPDAMATAANTSAAICLMHMQGEPATMQSEPQYVDPVTEIHDFLEARVAAAVAAGIDRTRLLVDPGFGFGKRLAHNLALLAQLPRIGALGLPVLIGLSRKSMLGALTGRDVHDRLAGGIAATALALQGGACIVRAHDVAATVDAARVVAAVREASGDCS